MATLVIKSVLLLSIVVTLQILGTRFGFVRAETDTGEHHFYRITMARCDAIVRKNPEVLYFGDSTVFPVPVPGDFRYTSEMLDTLLPQRQIVGFHGMALSPEFFADALDYFLRKGCRPKAVIVPINIRAFSTAFRHDPRYRFGDIRWLMKCDSLWYRAFYRQFAASGICDWRSMSEGQYYRSMKQEADTEPAFAAYCDSNGDPISLDHLRDFVFYGITMTDDNPGLAALVRMQNACKGINAEFVCYITPVSFENIERSLGDSVANTAHFNIQFAQKWLQRHEIKLLDLSDAVKPRDYFCTDASSSHMLATGRRRVAERLAQYLQSLEW